MLSPKGYKAIILKYLKAVRDLDRNGGWVLEGTIRSKQTDFGWIGFRGDRDCRDLVEAGLLEHRLNGKLAEVRYRYEDEGAPKLETPAEKKHRESREKEEAILASFKKGQAISY